MADFCTTCSLEMFGPKAEPDINVMVEFLDLNPGDQVSGFICEGCTLVAIANIDGQLRVARETQDLTWQPY